ncbi:MAG: hypothetical protein IJR45_04690 [Firmicutes bacterium]|nr:hypothetical protein [Bacillota bacterium]
MNKKAKRRISSFLAFTLCLSSMTANNVSIFAENEEGFPEGFALMEVDETESSEAIEFSTVDVEQYKAAIAESGDPDFFDAIEFSDAETGAIPVDTVLIDNEYGTMTASQNLTSTNFIGRGLQPVTIDGYTFDNKIQSSSVDTTISEMTGSTGAPTGLYRLAYKIVAKKDCKITAYTSGGNHAILLDAGSTNGQPADIDMGVGSAMGYGVAQDLAYIQGTGMASVDVSEGQIVYVAGQYTNDNYLGVRISAPSATVNATVKLTLDGAAVTEATDVTVSGFRAASGSPSTDAQGNYSFSGLASYDYTITATVGSTGYKGVLTISEDGTYPSTLDLSCVAAQSVLTILDASGTPVQDARVTLDYVDGTTPKRLQAYTDSNGQADFGSLDFTDYTVTVDAYDVSTNVFSPSKSSSTAAITATPSALPEVPADAQAGDTYVGYAPSDVSYFSVQEAVDAAAEGGTVYVAPGEYRGHVSITKSVNIVGADKDTTVIAYNDSQQGTDTGSPKTRFHGDTVVINAADAVVNFENITIANDAESTIPGIVQNATALSSYLENEVTENTITVTNCNLIATRDTIYTGSATSSNSWQFTDCNIYGFQDVCCGGGDAYIDDCTWLINFNGDARFLVPICRNDDDISFMRAENLTIKTADELVKADIQGAEFTKSAFLGRPWGNGPALSSTTKAIVVSYTDDEHIVPTNTVNGFDSNNGLSANGGLTATDWLVGVEGFEDTYLTTRWVDVNKFNSELSGSTVRGSYQLVGDFNEEMKDELDGVGFAVYDSDNNLVGVAANKSAYTIKGSEDTTPHAVAYINNAPAKFKVKAASVVGSDTYIYGSNNAAVTVG